MLLKPIGLMRAVVAGGGSQAQYVTDSDVTVKVNSSVTLTISSFTPGTGTNRAIVLLISGNYLRNVEDITYSGTEEPTLIGTASGSAYGRVYAYIWPTYSASSGDIAVTFSAGQQCVATAFCVDNVDQTTPTADGTSLSGTASSSSLTVANRTANDLVIGAVSVDANTGSVSVTAGTAITIDREGYANTGFAYRADGDNISFSHPSGDRGAYAFRIIGG